MNTQETTTIPDINDFETHEKVLKRVNMFIPKNEVRTRSKDTITYELKPAPSQLFDSDLRILIDKQEKETSDHYNKLLESAKNN